MINEFLEVSTLWFNTEFTTCWRGLTKEVYIKLYVELLKIAKKKKKKGEENQLLCRHVVIIVIYGSKTRNFK